MVSTALSTIWLRRACSMKLPLRWLLAMRPDYRPFGQDEGPRRRCRSPSKNHRSAKALAQRSQLVVQAARHLLTDLVEPLLDQRQLGAPLLRVHPQRIGEVRLALAQTVGVQVGRGRHVTDRGLLGTRLALDALDRPL